MIRVKGLGKRFASRLILRGLNFEAAEGEIIALAGPNGAGKTTFLRILATLSRPSAGMAEINGLILPDYANEIRSIIGYLGHQTLLYPDLSAEQNLRFYGKLFDVNNVEERIDETLELVGLSKRRRDPVQIYSRGMQQRLAIARTLFHAPKILLLDEAHTGLDQQGIESLNELLVSVAKSGSTIVMSSHDLDIVSEFSDRVDVLVDGQFKASLTGRNLEPVRLLKKYRELTAVARKN
jgi:heme exporter protein A